MTFLRNSILFPSFLSLIHPTLTKVSSVWYNEATDRDRLKTELCATAVTTVSHSFERQRSSIQSYRLVHTSARDIESEQTVRSFVFPSRHMCESFCFALAFT